MSQLVSLDMQQHAALRIDTQAVISQAVNLVPVVVSEFLKLCVDFPIVISKQAETGQFHCSALLGLLPGQNLYAGDSDRCLYWPANIQRQPFFLGRGVKVDDFVVCIDPNHESVSDDGDQPVFESGQESAYLTRMKGLLAELLKGEAPTRNFLAQLQQHQLLIPMQLDIAAANQQPRRLNGLYTVDDRKLQQLPDAAIVDLQASGAMALIYTMLASQGQIYRLVQWQNQLLSAAAA